jgi:sugar phosphate isomerase/epimerase
MQINYAVSTMIFWGRENSLSFEQECEFLQSLGFGIELWPNIKDNPECRYDKRNWPRLAEATEGMLVTMRSRNDNPTLEQWKEQIECAKLLKAHIVTDLKSIGIPETHDLNGCDFAGKVIQAAMDKDIKICVETGRLPLLKQMSKRFPSIWYCLDTGYANINKEYTFREFVDELAPKIAHLHLSDNYGKNDDHVAPGLHGGIHKDNWQYLLNVLDEYENNVVASLEMSPCLPGVMIRQASEFLFDVLKWPKQPQKSALLTTLLS